MWATTYQITHANSLIPSSRFPTVSMETVEFINEKRWPQSDCALKGTLGLSLLTYLKQHFFGIAYITALHISLPEFQHPQLTQPIPNVCPNPNPTHSPKV